jgi:hypothetical protein
MASHGLLQLDYRHLDTVEAHARLGEAVWEQVHKILDYKIEAVKLAGVAESIRNARHIEAAVTARIQDGGIEPVIQQALQIYMQSLRAWARGARLDGYRHERLQDARVDGKPITGGELAMILQTELMGCQTGMVRDQDGAIWLWHTEEDVDKTPDGRFDAIRTFACR